MYGLQRLIICLYTTGGSLGQLREHGAFYDMTKLWRKLYDERSNKKVEVEFVNKIEDVIWSLQYEVYEDLYATTYEWIEPEITKAELKCDMLSRINLEIVEGHALYKTHFRKDEIDDSWWLWTHDPEEQVAFSETDSDDIEDQEGGMMESVMERFQQRCELAQQQMAALIAHNRPQQQ